LPVHLLSVEAFLIVSVIPSFGTPRELGSIAESSVGDPGPQGSLFGEGVPRAMLALTSRLTGKGGQATTGRVQHRTGR